MCRLFFCFFFLFAVGPALAMQAQVAEVRSCDSITVTSDAGKSATVRLFGVVCPKSGGTSAQPYSAEALAFLRQMLPKDAPVALHDMRRDTMGRERGYTITLPSGLLVQTALLEAGLAWVSPTHCGACRAWKISEKKARLSRTGLWSEENPVPPWEWEDAPRQKTKPD